MPRAPAAGIAKSHAQAISGLGNGDVDPRVARVQAAVQRVHVDCLPDSRFAVFRDPSGNLNLPATCFTVIPTATRSITMSCLAEIGTGSSNGIDQALREGVGQAWIFLRWRLIDDVSTRW